MTEIILKNDIGEERLKALIDFLKSWNIDAEVKSDSEFLEPDSQSEYSLAEGMWKDYKIDAKDLRKEAWRTK
jgi:tRNA A37 threonylcarbamoyladenosine dehydratase